ncbi:MAG: thioredoxin domain-containing protein [Rhodothermales bacterium]|nr:thioredoxin domain-containing protein [Rhodothermales bacterium]
MSIQRSLTLDGVTGPAILSFVSGIGMVVSSLLTIDHFFAANYPESIFEGSFCDISSFFNCDSSAYSSISAVFEIPLGFFGLIVGLLVVLGVVFPSEGFERTNKSIAFLNAAGVIALLLYSVLFLGSLCLLCSGFYLFSLLSFALFAKYGRIQKGSFMARYFQPSIKHLVVFAVMTALGGYGVRQYHVVKEEAQSGGVAARVVKQFYGLEKVQLPSVISPLWSVRSTETFEDAPIHIVEYGDFLCSDCLFLSNQLDRAKEEFAGKINIAFQHFPLEARCNDVVEKDKHPGACELAYLSSYDIDNFASFHDEVFANFDAAKKPEWRAALAERYDITNALTDSANIALVHRLIQTGREYGQTSAEYEYGIRSTPTMIVNGRMIIGTLPYTQLRAIFQALVDEAEGNPRFIEAWQDMD